MTKFYDRKKELESLEQIEKNSFKNENFTLITGRRRIGKTTLLKKFIEGKKTVICLQHVLQKLFYVSSGKINLKNRLG